MITFTREAKEELKRLAELHEGVFRLTIRTKGCAGTIYELLLADRPEDNDTETNCGDFLLYLDGEKIMYFNGTHIDHKDDIEGRRFVFSNATFDTCGCGNSFRVGGIG